MRIRMLKTVQGSPDGVRVLEYRDGTEHDLSATPRERELAAAFLAEQWAEPVQALPEPASTLRLPPIEEYVAAGYDPADYERFLASGREEAAANGLTAKVASAPQGPEDGPGKASSPSTEDVSSPAPVADAPVDRKSKKKGR